MMGRARDVDVPVRDYKSNTRIYVVVPFHNPFPAAMADPLIISALAMATLCPATFGLYPDGPTLVTVSGLVRARMMLSVLGRDWGSVTPLATLPVLSDEAGLERVKFGVAGMDCTSP